ncbi:hypothetical protein [Vibrio cholerae]|uniref:hypothetical protein n=1 Tax=Vibrio cholerae TaxID=666 RepID=UPI0002C17BD8|nr:hypothetical protein [Vibrio cholerae]EMQ60349.1 hypothetical protein VCEM1676A_003130 [Vibrio cholerae O1 str. EM-1676A]
MTIEKMMKMRSHLAQQEWSLEKQGDIAESIAEKLFERKGWNYEKVPQKILGRSASLKKYKAKRPDYILEVQEEYKDDLVIVADVKFIKIENDEVKFEQAEIEKYRGLIEYIKSEYSVKEAKLLFVIFPKADDFQKVLYVSLTAYDNAKKCKLNGKDALCINVSDPNVISEDNLWV